VKDIERFCSLSVNKYATEDKACIARTVS